jgi:hypothetical protein
MAIEIYVFFMSKFTLNLHTVRIILKFTQEAH